MKIETIDWINQSCVDEIKKIIPDSYSYDEVKDSYLSYFIFSKVVDEFFKEILAYCDNRKKGTILRMHDSDLFIRYSNNDRIPALKLEISQESFGKTRDIISPDPKDLNVSYYQEHLFPSAHFASYYIHFIEDTKLYEHYKELIIGIFKNILNKVSELEVSDTDYANFLCSTVDMNHFMLIIGRDKEYNPIIEVYRK